MVHWLLLLFLAQAQAASLFADLNDAQREILINAIEEQPDMLTAAPSAVLTKLRNGGNLDRADMQAIVDILAKTRNPAARSFVGAMQVELKAQP